MPTSFGDRRRIESLELQKQQYQMELQAQAFRPDRVPSKRTTYLAETVAGPSSYPTTGDTFYVRFLDIDWNPSVPSSSFTKKPRSNTSQVIAKCVSGEHLKVNTLCLCLFQPPPLGTTDKGRWVIYPLKSDKLKLVFFKLTTPLECGSTATAKIQEWDATAGEWVDGDTITVKDEYGDLHALAGYKGWASTRQIKQGTDESYSPVGTDVYSIVYVDHQAIFIEFTLAADMTLDTYTSSYKAMATATRFYQGQTPPVDDNAGLMVWDTQGLFKDMKEGDKGKAVWSQCAGKYIVWVGKGDGQLTMFHLTEELVCGGEAGALTVDGEVITVKDVYGDRHGLYGAVGWAVPGAAEEPWKIVVVDHQAIFIEFTLTSGFASGSATATVDLFYQGMGPPNEPQGGVTVYDDQGFFPRAMIGSKGKAVWDQCNKKYKVYECQQMARVLKADLVGAMCPGDPFGDITNVVNADFSPFNMMPNPVPDIGSNSWYSLAGEAGNEVWLEYDHAFGGYQIVQVRHKTVKLLKNVRYNDQTCRIEGLRVECAVMTCKPVPLDNASDGWETLIQLNSQTYLTDARLAHVPAGYGEPGSCSIEAEYSTVCGFGVPEVAGFFSVADFSKQQVTIDVWKDAHYTKLYQTQVDIWVPCIGSDTYNVVADLTYCCGETVQPTTCCCGLTESDTLKLTFSDGEGRLECLNGHEYILAWDAGLSRWKVTDGTTCIAEPSFNTLEVTCVCGEDGSTNMTVNIATGGDFLNWLGAPDSISCDPVPSFSGTAFSYQYPGPFARTVRFTITKV